MISAFANAFSFSKGHSQKRRAKKKSDATGNRNAPNLSHVAKRGLLLKTVLC
ncbi:hypothetical protein BN2476_1190006 [Paraburkholderia piptadeniae]|uniref:Uncharacterized protein n=1 Tax=Paraburkholderia piptadeniae TaxID=1701573 RepID=A0A1N7SV81_9BURK|nr:hypothetical protein BN2476_1190006 [Paraburkholderia piptadeniae]